jgi:hypothetical protein
VLKPLHWPLGDGSAERVHLLGERLELRIKVCSVEFCFNWYFDARHFRMSLIFRA